MFLTLKAFYCTFSFPLSSVYLCKPTRNPFIPVGTSMFFSVFAKAEFASSALKILTFAMFCVRRKLAFRNEPYLIDDGNVGSMLSLNLEQMHSDSFIVVRNCWSSFCPSDTHISHVCGGISIYQNTRGSTELRTRNELLHF